MNEAELKALILDKLGDVVRSHEEVENLDPEENLQEQLDIDSMDMLKFVTALQTALGLEIPGRDYERFTTLAGCLAYLTPQLEQLHSAGRINR
jgi:acyl carrier protein